MNQRFEVVADVVCENRPITFVMVAELFSDRPYRNQGGHREGVCTDAWTFTAPPLTTEGRGRRYYRDLPPE